MPLRNTINPYFDNSVNGSTIVIYARAPMAGEFDDGGRPLNLHQVDAASHLAVPGYVKR